MSRIKVSTGAVRRDMRIADGRDNFWQWDTGCTLTALGMPLGTELHFYRAGMSEPLTLKIYKSENALVCDVPDEVLQEAVGFIVYAYVPDDDGCCTVFEKTFTVKERPKPTNYIYTETEKHTVEEALASALENAKESGEFDGVDGKDGVSVEHHWNGTVLTVKSASGESSSDLKGEKGDKGDNLFEDIVTQEKYKLYVSNGKLMMEKVGE